MKTVLVLILASVLLLSLSEAATTLHLTPRGAAETGLAMLLLVLTLRREPVGRH